MVGNQWHDEFGLRLDAILRGDDPDKANTVPTEPSAPEQKGVLEGFGLQPTPKEESNMRDREPTQEELDMIAKEISVYNLKFFELQRQAIELCYRAREQHTTGLFQTHNMVRGLESFREDTPGDIERLESIVQIMRVAEKVGWE